MSIKKVSSPKDNTLVSLLKLQLEAGKLSQGYMLVGYLTKALDVAHKIKESLAEEKKSSEAPDGDFLELIGDSIGIDDVREIIRKAYLKTYSAIGRIFFIDAEFITQEASNALLKITEEPPENTIFFIRVPSEDKLINTLKSRLVKIILPPDDPAELLEYFSDFKNKSYIKKMEYIKKMAGDKEAQEKFISACEVYADNIMKNGKNNDQEIQLAADLIERIMLSRRLMAEPASYPKAILEYLIINKLLI